MTRRLSCSTEIHAAPPNNRLNHFYRFRFRIFLNHISPTYKIPKTNLQGNNCPKYPKVKLLLFPKVTSFIVGKPLSTATLGSIYGSLDFPSPHVQLTGHTWKLRWNPNNEGLGKCCSFSKRMISGSMSVSGMFITGNCIWWNSTKV